MTEAEWLAGQDLVPLLTFWQESGWADARKLRLFAATCCRGLPDHLLDEDDRAAIELVERVADAEATVEELAERRARLTGRRATADRVYHVTRAVAALLGRDAARTARDAAHHVAAYHYNAAYNRRLLRHDGPAPAACSPGTRAAEVGWGERARRDVQRDQVRLLRDLVGNPFRPAEIAPAWRTPLVRAVANTISDERRFQDMPILGDALEEAGCTDPAILGHCRGTGPHARGCWLLDGLIGRGAEARLAA